MRTLAPGTTFVLTNHAIHEADRIAGDDSSATFAVIAVQHRARNNLSFGARVLICDVFANSAAAKSASERIAYVAILLL